VYYQNSTGVIKTELQLYALFEFEPLLAALLAAHPDVKIVLSTSWVHQAPDGLRLAMDQLSSGLRARVIGSTFHSSGLPADVFAKIQRGEQVMQYVRKHNIGSDRWLALDDRRDGFDAVQENLLQTYPYAGIADPGVLRQLLSQLDLWKMQDKKLAARTA